MWNPDSDHLDKNWQIGTYISVHSTDMYVHVYEVTPYRHEHVLVCLVHAIMIYMYINIQICTYMPVYMYIS
jgi:hypothetical protein